LSAPDIRVAVPKMAPAGTMIIHVVKATVPPGDTGTKRACVKRTFRPPVLFRDPPQRSPPFPRLTPSVPTTRTQRSGAPRRPGGQAEGEDQDAGRRQGDVPDLQRDLRVV